MGRVTPPPTPYDLCIVFIRARRPLCARKISKSPASAIPEIWGVSQNLKVGARPGVYGGIRTPV